MSLEKFFDPYNYTMALCEAARRQARVLAEQDKNKPQEPRGWFKRLCHALGLASLQPK